MSEMIKTAVDQSAPKTAPRTSGRSNARKRSAERIRYCGNDVLHLAKVLDDAKTDMERKCLSMNDVVHLMQDRLDGILRTRMCTLAELASLVTSAGFPVTERTLKDYLARSRKDAREGRTELSELKKHILDTANKQAGMACESTAAPFLSAEDDSKEERAAGSDDFAVREDDGPATDVHAGVDSTEAAEKKKQHVRDFYAARKRRKKARNAKKRR